MTLSEQEHQVVQRGLASASLLANEDLRTLISSLIFEGYATFTDSKPEEGERREHIYYLNQGLRAIEGELNARVAAYEEIQRRLNASDQDADDDSALINDNELGE